MTRNSVIPASILWNDILNRTVTINLFEDNRSVLFIVSTGRNRTLRHFERTHRVSVAWLNEIYVRHKYVKWYFAASAEMLADLFTKHFTNRLSFERLRTLVGIAASVDDMMKAAAELVSLRETFDPCEYDRPRIRLDFCQTSHFGHSTAETLDIDDEKIMCRDEVAFYNADAPR